jgi:hypothetical protein
MATSCIEARRGVPLVSLLRLLEERRVATYSIDRLHLKVLKPNGFSVLDLVALGFNDLVPYISPQRILDVLVATALLEQKRNI